MVKNTLTTYEVAQYAQVTPRTVIQWINEGKLKAYRTPGNHSRISYEEFLVFLRKYNMPIPKELLVEGGNEKKRVLIVDDDKGIVDAIKRFLVREKIYDMEFAYDGFDAGEKFASFKPHLIILDIRMPGLDGFHLCSRIKANPDNKNVKILFISGTIDEEAVNKISQLGADGFLMKPFSIVELKSKLQEMFSWNRRLLDRVRNESENI